jgi:hypothetical protein
MPCTAIAIRPASAACSWTAASVRLSFGLSLVAISSPMITDRVMSPRAIRPDARLASHQP